MRFHAAFVFANGGKADMTFCGNPLARSLSGVKRTSLVAVHMSAFEGKADMAIALRHIR